MKKLFAVVFVFALLGACAPRTAAEKASQERLFDKCMQQAAAFPKPGLKLLDTSEDVIAACEGYAFRNS